MSGTRQSQPFLTGRPWGPTRHLFLAHYPTHPATHLLRQVGVIYGNPEVTSGGESLKYYSSVRVDLRVRERIQGPQGQVGIRVK